jgi:hypothetical protein
MHPRVTNKWARERPVPRHCEVPACGVATRAGKPYCSEHVDRHPYVSELLAQIAAREAEEAQVRARGAAAVDLDGLTATEVLTFLRVHGERSVPRLARDLNMDLRTVAHYVSALARRGEVELGENRRGKTLVALPGELTKGRRRRRVQVALPEQALPDLGTEAQAGGAA